VTVAERLAFILWPFAQGASERGESDWIALASEALATELATLCTGCHARAFPPVDDLVECSECGGAILP